MKLNKVNIIGGMFTLFESYCYYEAKFEELNTIQKALKWYKQQFEDVTQDKEQKEAAEGYLRRIEELHKVIKRKEANHCKRHQVVTWIDHEFL